MTDEEFLKFVYDYITTNHNNDKPFTDEKYVEIVSDCKGYDCELSPNREDCCPNKDGKCHITININKLCGVDDILETIPTLTPNEVKTITDFVVSMNKEK